MKFLKRNKMYAIYFFSDCLWAIKSPPVTSRRLDLLLAFKNNIKKHVFSFSPALMLYIFSSGKKPFVSDLKRRFNKMTKFSK